MKIGLINGSPKAKDSCSGSLLAEFSKLITGGNDIVHMHIANNKIDPAILSKAVKCDVIVFSFPLYVDGVPSHLLRFMTELKDLLLKNENKDIRTYAIVNCGFFEGKQAKSALQIIENWSERAGIAWGMGVGVGAGGMIMSIKSVPLGHGPKKNLGKAFASLAEMVVKKDTTDNIYINANFPRFLYKFGAHQGWKAEAKKNGLKKKDLYYNQM